MQRQPVPNPHLQNHASYKADQSMESQHPKWLVSSADA